MNKRITDLPAITSINASVDPLPIVDIDDTSQSGSGTTKKITINQIASAISSSSPAIYSGTSTNPNGVVTALTGSIYFDISNPAVPVQWVKTGTNWEVYYDSFAPGSNVLVVNNVAAIKALVPSTLIDGQIILTRGYYTENDGGQGSYIYDSTSAAADNGGTVIAPTAGAGRYLLQIDGKINIRQAGNSIANAVASLPNGGQIYFPAGTYSSPGTLTVSNISFVGEKRPDFKSDYTGLIGGTIINGPFVFRGNNLEFHNLGVDSGSAVCNSLYSGTAQEGLVCTVNYLAGQPQFVDLVVNNVCAIAKDASSAVHAFSVEGYTNPNIDGVDTVYGSHGQAYKIFGGLVSNVRSRYSAGECFIFKSDTTRQCKRTVFSNFQADGENASNTYGLVLQNYFGVAGNYLEINDLVISDGYIRNCGTGFMLQGNINPGTDLTRDVAVSNVICSNNSFLGFRIYGHSRRITFSNCHALTSYSDGWQIGAQAAFTRIIGCSSSNSGSTGGTNYGNGITIEGTDTDVDSFTTYDNNGFGVYIKSGSTTYFNGLRGFGNVFSGNETDLIYRDANVFPSSRNLPIAFTNLTLTSPWVNLGGNGPAQIMKGIDNVVWMRGTVQNTTTGSVIATIPERFRPVAPNYLRWNATCYFGGVVDNPAVLQLDPTTGQLSVIGSRGIGAGTWIQIDYRWPAYR